MSCRPGGGWPDRARWLYRLRRSRRRSTWSASSASRARAPSTTAAGAFSRNASLASRSRAEPSSASAWASSRSRRARSSAGLGDHVRPLSDDCLGLTGDHRESALIDGDAQFLRREVASQRPRARQPLDGRPKRRERLAQSRRHVEVNRQPGGRLDLRVRSGVPDPAHHVEDGLDVGLDRPVPLALRWPARLDQQRWVRSAMRQRAPDRLRHERHERVEQTQEGVQRLDERPPGRFAVGRRQAGVGQSDLRELDAPVAELIPDGFVLDPRGLAERVVGHGGVDVRDRGGGARQQPSLRGPEAGFVRRKRVPHLAGSWPVGRPARIEPRSRACSRSSGRSPVVVARA